MYIYLNVCMNVKNIYGMLKLNIMLPKHISLRQRAIQIWGQKRSVKTQKKNCTSPMTKDSKYNDVAVMAHFFLIASYRILDIWDLGSTVNQSHCPTKLHATYVHTLYIYTHIYIYVSNLSRVS